jgi:hypothetical protein
MVMYPLICYYHSTCIIYSCLNVLTDRTSGRSASVVVSGNLFKKFIKIKGRESEQTKLNSKESTKVKNRSKCIGCFLTLITPATRILRNPLIQPTTYGFNFTFKKAVYSICESSKQVII